MLSPIHVRHCFVQYIVYTSYNQIAVITWLACTPSRSSGSPITYVIRLDANLIGRSTEWQQTLPEPTSCGFKQLSRPSIKLVLAHIPPGYLANFASHHHRPSIKTDFLPIPHVFNPIKLLTLPLATINYRMVMGEITNYSQTGTH